MDYKYLTEESTLIYTIREDEEIENLTMNLFNQLQGKGYHI